jgi:hypothetical protein
VYNSSTSKFENKFLNLSQLGDVNTTGTLNGYSLTYNSALSKWVGSAPTFDINATAIALGSGSSVVDYNVAIGISCVCQALYTFCMGIGCRTPSGTNGSVMIGWSNGSACTGTNNIGIGRGNLTNEIWSGSMSYNNIAIGTFIDAEVASVNQSICLSTGLNGATINTGSIVLNTGSSLFRCTLQNACYINPIRQTTMPTNYNNIYHNTDTQEVFKNARLYSQDGIEITAGTVQNSFISSTFNYTSDGRVKENIIKRDSSKVLDNILKLNVCEYNYINKKDIRKNGLIAQEVENTEYNDCVITTDGITKYGDVEVENLKLINYDKINVDLIICCQELIKKNTVLENRMALMEDQINMIMQRVYKTEEPQQTIPDPVKITTKIPALRKTVSIRKS